MSEKFNEKITKPFDPILAEELSILIHKACCDKCPHDLGIKAAQLAHDFYSENEFGVEING